MKLSQFIAISLLGGCALWLIAGAANPQQVPATALPKNQTVMLIVNSNRPPLRSNFWSNVTPIQMGTNASICQQFVRDHQWKPSLMNLPMMPKTFGVLTTFEPVFYCTNCGVLRIEVGK